MCLYLKSLTPKYTTKDKIVYKWLTVPNGVIVSPFRGFVYNLGEVYTSLLTTSCGWMALSDYERLSICGNFPIKLIAVPQRALFRYSLSGSYIERLIPAVAFRKFEVDLGLHTLDSIESAIKYKKTHPMYNIVFLYECTIPKHSWYYEGKDGEIASDQLIINKLCVLE